MRGTEVSTEQAMRLAISEAYKGAARVSPNPLVGSVVLDSQNRFISAGHHEFYGGPHAEVNALKNISESDLKGAHLIVTLEPCAHEGKTPSCAKLIARLPVKKVTFGLLDPNPLVAGKGLEILRQAGITVEEFPKLKSELEEVCEAFLKNFREKKIFSTLKIASTLDGRTAETTGHSQWVTNTESRQYAHYLRACYDAVLVGARTIEKDNPKLNIRHPSLTKENKIVILDREAKVLNEPNRFAIFQVHKPENILVITSDKTKLDTSRKPLAVVHMTCSEQNGHLSLSEAFQCMWNFGIRSTLVESGGALATSLLDQNWVDRLHLFMSTQVLGPGLSWSEHLRSRTLQSSIQLDSTSMQIFGDNVYLTGKVRK